MSEWQKGDLALCVRAGLICPDCGAVSVSQPGMITTVKATPIIDYEGVGEKLCLLFRELPDEHRATPMCWLYGYDPARFRKVTPPKADEFDREVIEAMTGAPVGEPA